MTVPALAVILGRAGSKGVPGKNMRIIGGRPSAAWTLQHAIDAKKVGAIDRIAVSTDCPDLSRLAGEMDVEVVKRPAELATDGATVDDSVRHAVQTLGGGFDIIVILYANVPIRPAGLVARAVTLLRDTNADSVQSYEPVGKHHPWWTAVVASSEQGGTVRPWEGDILNHGVYRRQDLPTAHIPDGGVLAVTGRALALQIPGVQPGPHAFFGRDRRGIINPEGSVVDIDSEIDLLVADAMLRARGATSS